MWNSKYKETVFFNHRSYCDNTLDSWIDFRGNQLGKKKFGWSHECSTQQNSEICRSLTSKNLQHAVNIFLFTLSNVTYLILRKDKQNERTEA